MDFIATDRFQPFLKPTLLLSLLALPASSVGVVTPKLPLFLPPARLLAAWAALDSATTQSSSRTLFSRSRRSMPANNSFLLGPGVQAQKQPATGQAPSDADAADRKDWLERGEDDECHMRRQAAWAEWLHRRQVE